MNILPGIVIAGTPLFVIEALSRYTKKSGELSRKLVHVFSSIAVANLLWFYDLNQIAEVAAVFIVVLAISRQLRVWRSLYKINRGSWGEVAFAGGVLGAALISNSKTIFLGSMLVMGIADTAAYYFGSRFGYLSHRLLGKKTTVGSLAFYVVSLTILAQLFGFSLAIFGVCIIATVVELLSVYGFDNLFLPLVLAAILNLVSL